MPSATARTALKHSARQHITLLKNSAEQSAMVRRDAAHSLLTAGVAAGLVRLFVLVGVAGIEPATSAV
jgi:hypothetical protein